MIPPNTTALLHFPDDVATRILESGQDIRQSAGVSLVLRDERIAVYEAGAGSYSFIIQR